MLQAKPKVGSSSLSSWRASIRPQQAGYRRATLVSQALASVTNERSLAALPEFGNPPVVEVALGIQFRSIYGLRPIELAPLRDRWRPKYPLVQEQPPQPPFIEAVGLAPVQFSLGPTLQSRLWFLDEPQAELVQLQHDRLTVNWRQTGDARAYPRYPHVRQVFLDRYSDLRAFVAEAALGSIDVTQAEVTYINAIEPEGARQGRLEQVLRVWQAATDHHLGEPEQARAALVFTVPDIGQAPVRMYVTVDPAQRPDGQPVVFLTLTVRGAPADDGLDAALQFLDEAHSHVVRSFAELTPTAMHERWDRRQ